MLSKATVNSSQYGRSTARRISKAARRWSARRSHVSRGASSMPSAGMSKRSARPAPMARLTMKRLPTKRPRASMLRAASRASPKHFSQKPVTSGRTMGPRCVVQAVLEARYPWLATAEARRGARATTKSDQQLDVAAVVKASQALSSEMRLVPLIERLMTIALQNAGCRPWPIRHPADQKAPTASKRAEQAQRIEGDGIVLTSGGSDGSSVPETLIRYVMRDGGERDPGRRDSATSLFRGSVSAIAPTAIDPLPSSRSPGRAPWSAVPGERTGARGLHAGGAHTAVGALGVASRDLARERCSLFRSATSGGASAASSRLRLYAQT